MTLTTETPTPSAASPSFDYRQALKRERGIGMHWLHFFDNYLNRPVAALLVRMVYYRSWVTPDRLTHLAGLLGMAAAAMMAQGTPRWTLAAALLAQLSSLVDSADGLLARARGVCSEYGATIDLIWDRVVDFALLSAMAIGHYRASGSVLLLVVGFVGVGLYQLQITLFYLIKTYRRDQRRGNSGEIRAILFWLILFFAAIQRMDLAIWVLLTETALSVTLHLTFFLIRGKPTHTA